MMKIGLKKVIDNHNDWVWTRQDGRKETHITCSKKTIFDCMGSFYFRFGTKPVSAPETFKMNQCCQQQRGFQVLLMPQNPAAFLCPRKL